VSPAPRLGRAGPFCSYKEEELWDTCTTKPVEVRESLARDDEWDEYDESEWPFRGPYRVLQRIEVPEEELAKVGLDRYPIYPPRD